MKQFSKARCRRSNFNHWRNLQLTVLSKPHKIPFLCTRAGIMKLGLSTAVGGNHIPVVLRFNSIGFENIKRPAGERVWLSKRKTGHSFCQLVNNAEPQRYNVPFVRSQYKW